jgi:hypothetical protein
MQAGVDHISHTWWLDHIPLATTLRSTGLQAGYLDTSVL